MIKLKSAAPYIIGLLLLIGLVLRLYQIHDNQFLFYDEAMYIGYNRAFLNLIANNPAHSFSEFCIILSLIFKTALAMPKPLWFFLLSLRVFFLGPEAWYFARLISAFSGLATVVLVYFWAQRYSKSKTVGILSALVLLLLPSHVFYSRSGMQEALSALLFLSGIALYTWKEKFSWQHVAAAICLACVYFTNYRMIVAPVFIVFIECFNAWIQHKKIDWFKLGIVAAVFLALVIIVGSLYGAVNFQITSAWMFHQAQDAGGKFNVINFISFPFDVFALEGVFVGMLFWGNVYFFKTREYAKLLPFGIVVLQMGIFSLAAEKGARYLCVVLPFLAVAAAVLMEDLWRKIPQQKIWVLVFGALTAASMIVLSTQETLSRTEYDKAMEMILEHDPQAKIVSTQPLVEALFLPDEKQIIPCPKDLNSLAALYSQGARYLVIDPQVYISWTANGRRFSPPLIDFLENTRQFVQPLATFGHLNQTLLTRLVLDHNEQILDSLSFLNQAPSKQYGQLRIYDLGAVFAFLQHQYQ